MERVINPFLRNERLDNNRTETMMNLPGNQYSGADWSSRDRGLGREQGKPVNVFLSRLSLGGMDSQPELRFVFSSRYLRSPGASVARCSTVRIAVPGLPLFPCERKE